MNLTITSLSYPSGTPENPTTFYLDPSQGYSAAPWIEINFNYDNNSGSPVYIFAGGTGTSLTFGSPTYDIDNNPLTNKGLLRSSGTSGEKYEYQLTDANGFPYTLVERINSQGVSRYTPGEITSIKLYMQQKVGNSGFGSVLKEVSIPVNYLFIGDADVSVTKSNLTNPVIVGKEFTYTITISNNGPYNAGAVVLTEVLPKGVTYVGSDFPAEVTQVDDTTKLRIPIQYVSSNTNFPTQVNIRVIPTEESKPQGNELFDEQWTIQTSTSVASGSRAINDPNLGNNSATQTIQVIKAGGADLEVTATSDQDVIGIGPELTYTFTVANKGTVDATGVNLTITIPQGLNLISSSFTPISTTTDSAGNTVLTIDAGSIQKGGAFTAQATVEVTGFSQPLDKLREYLWDINVSASAQASQSEINTSNNSASKTVEVDSSLGLAEDLVREFLLGSSPSSLRSVQATSLSVTDSQAMTMRSAAAQETGGRGLAGIAEDGANQFVDRYQNLGNKYTLGVSETIRTQVEEVDKFRDHAEEVKADPEKAADISKVKNFVKSFDNSRKAIQQQTDQTIDEAKEIPVQVAQSVGEQAIDYALRAAGDNPIVAGFLKRFDLGVPEGFSYNNGVISYEYTSPSEGVNFNLGVKVGKIEDYSEAGLAAIRQGKLTLFTQEAQNNAKNTTANASLSLQQADTTLSATVAYDNSTKTGTAGLNSEYRSNLFSPNPNIKDTKFGVSAFGQFSPGQQTVWGAKATISTDVGKPNNQRLQLNSFDSELIAAPLGAMNLTTDSAQATTTERVSVATDGTQGDSFSTSAILSGDGHFLAFNSAASSLVTSDTNGVLDVFVRNLQTNTTERVNIANDGSQANDESDVYAISADGRFVVFASDASNLVAGDTNGVRDIFVRDRQTGTTQRVSLASDGSQANGVSDIAAISADGRYVVFSSIASNLVAGDTNEQVDVFVRDLQTGTTEQISLASNGTQGDGDSLSPGTTISADGRYVAFYSYASNLVANDTNENPDVFVRDRQTGTTKRISVGTNGTEANDISLSPSISADGRYIVFSSLASNLVAGDTNETGDIFVYDQQIGTLERVSLTSDETEADSNSSRPAISADGRYVVFQSRASNLGVDNPDFWNNIYLRDRQTGETKLISLAPGTTTDGDSTDPFISGDGSRIAFESDATNLIAGDTNGVRDIFLGETPSPTTAIGSDFNGDGQTDILWHHQTTGQNAVWLMNGTNLAGGVLIEPAVTDLNWNVVGTGDFNGDDQTDILWHHQTTGQNAVWLMNGTNLAEGVLIEPAVTDLNWNAVGTGDFNGDDQTDILWHHQTTGQNAVWLMNGTNLAGGVLIEPAVTDLNWNVVGTGDFNGDDQTDILWHHQTTGQNAVWLMNGTNLAGGVLIEPAVTDLNWQIVA